MSAPRGARDPIVSGGIIISSGGGGGVGGASDEYLEYLAALRTRAADVAHNIDKIHLREMAPNWPRIQSQFAVLCAQIQTLYDELLTSERSWNGRLHTSQSLAQPLNPLFNPGTSLRIKPTEEAEAFEKAALADLANDSYLSNCSTLELRDDINEFNAAVLKLGRYCAQASMLPLPRDHNTLGRTMEQERVEENELQKTLATMMTGKQTKLQPAPLGVQGPGPQPLHHHAPQPQQQQQHHGSQHAMPYSAHGSGVAHQQHSSQAHLGQTTSQPSYGQFQQKHGQQPQM